MNLQEVLKNNPDAKEEFDILQEFGVSEIKRLLNYITVLEDMIESKAERAEILQIIDEHNGWTKWLRADGHLDENTEWWETVL